MLDTVFNRPSRVKTRILVIALSIAFSLSSSAQIPAPSAGAASPPTGAAVSLPAKDAPRLQAIADELKKADACKQAYSAKSDGPLAKQAKCYEALALLKAAELGDSSQAARCARVAAEVRSDKSLPISLRYQVAATADNQKIDRHLPYAACMAQFEAVARKHVDEFPEYPIAYEPLAHLAEDTPDDVRAQALAHDVLTSPASVAVKNVAQTVLDRHALVGRSARELLSESLLKKYRGKVIIVYSWSAENSGSRRLAHALEKTIPQGTILVGINLDKNPANAKALSGTELVPGEQIYDAEESHGAVASRLKMTHPGLAYAIGKDGLVKSINIASDLKNKILLVRNSN
jgi:hypothetical protein